MATGIASSIANAILDALCRSVTWSEPDGFYVQLHTGDPGSAGTANAATETTRKAVTFAAASGGVSTSSADVVWTNVAGTETYTHVSFWSASSSGTFLGSDSLGASVMVTAGSTFTIEAGDATVSLSPVGS